MTTDVNIHHKAERTHPLYDEMAASPEFVELRKRYRGFVFPATAAFLSWYLLFVVLSIWAHDFMSFKLVGNINVALVFGLLQFATTFALAWMYSRFSTAQLDPLARQLNASYESNRAKRSR